MAKFSPGEIIPCEIVPGRNFPPPCNDNRVAEYFFNFCHPYYLSADQIHKHFLKYNNSVCFYEKFLSPIYSNFTNTFWWLLYIYAAIDGSGMLVTMENLRRRCGVAFVGDDTTALTPNLLLLHLNPVANGNYDGKVPTLETVVSTRLQVTTHFPKTLHDGTQRLGRTNDCYAGLPQCHHSV